MDVFEQSNSEKETNDSHNTFYQNAIYYKGHENAFIRKLKVCYIFSCLCYKTRERMTVIFSRRKIRT